MLDALKREAHYQYRCIRLGWGFLAKRFIHCNLQITYRCNFSCQICDFWKTPHDPSEELSLEEIRIIGRKLNRLGTLIVSLAGGEPVMRKDLFDIISILNEENHFPILITNGWYVDETVAKEILRAGLQEISVSIDYADPAKHDSQRGRAGAWQRGMNALELLLKYRPDRRNRIHMISVLMDDNLNEIEKMIGLAKKIGVTYMVNLYSWNRGTKKSRLPRNQVTKHLMDLKKKYPEFITLTSYIEKIDQAVSEGGIGDCQTGKLLLNIDNKGNVARCTETLTDPVGNMLRDDVMEIRKRLHRVQRNSKCSQCWTSCRGFAECMYSTPRSRQFKEFYNSVKSRG